MKVTIFMFSVLTVLLVPACVWAESAPTPPAQPSCACAEKPSLDKAIADSSMVFTGRVTGIRKSVLREGQQEVSINPLRIFIGFPSADAAREVVVYTPIDETKCPFLFQLNQDYLLFVHGNPAYLKIDRCGKTQQLDLAIEEAQELEQRFAEDDAAAQ